MVARKTTSHLEPHAALGGQATGTPLQIRFNRPLLPGVEDPLPYLNEIMQSRWGTNGGNVCTLERELADRGGTHEH